MYPILSCRIRYWIIQHILRIDTPYLLHAAIVQSPLASAAYAIYAKRHEVSFKVLFSETTYTRFKVEVQML